MKSPNKPDNPRIYMQDVMTLFVLNMGIIIQISVIMFCTCIYIKGIKIIRMAHTMRTYIKYNVKYEKMYVHFVYIYLEEKEIYTSIFYLC